MRRDLLQRRRATPRAQSGLAMVRTLAISGVLLVLLGIPLWMQHSRDPAKRPVDVKAAPAADAKSFASAPLVPASEPEPPAAASASSAAMALVKGADAMGLTYVLGAMAGVGERVSFECKNTTHPESCNRQRGDTSCRVVLPVLCERAEAVSGVARQLGATQPVMGAVLDTEQAAHQRCAAELGQDWRMAAAPADGGTLEGAAHASLTRDMRYWVRNPDAPTHCWGGAAG